jgi:DNA-binding transcriptional regulator of glucitol operon
MASGYRFAGSPRWLAGHVLVLAAAVGMVLLGHWQLTVSERKHFSVQNFGYALQWWAFTVFALVLWVKILRDRANGSPETEAGSAAEAAAVAAEPVAYRRYVMPQSSDGPIADVDPQQAAYNAYLASLARSDEDG